MKNPNQGASKEVLQRLKEASNERMRIELKNTLELKMRDFDMTWDDLARLLKMKKLIGKTPISKRTPRAVILQKRIIGGQVTLNDLNTLAHFFSCEPYILFRPRHPWVNS